MRLNAIETAETEERNKRKGSKTITMILEAQNTGTGNRHGSHCDSPRIHSTNQIGSTLVLYRHHMMGSL